MTTDRINGSLYLKTNEGVAVLEFGHPAGNSFVRPLLDRLTEAVNKLSEDQEVVVIVLQSEGDRAFCSGASLDEMSGISSLEEGTFFFSGFANLINAMRLCKKPIIGRVQGKVVGGGVGLAAACDYVYATVAASIRLSEISIGIAPLVIAPAVERKVGISGLAELSLAPKEWKSAYWGKEKGLFSEVYEDIREMDKELYFFAKSLSDYSPQALAALKETLWTGTSHWESLLPERAEQSGRLALSETAKKALQKIINKE